MSFLRLDPDERIVLILRRHWLVLLSDVVVSALFAVVIVPLWVLLPRAFPELHTASFDNLFASAIFVYLLFVWLGFFIKWTDYYLDIWIITTKRVMDVEQKGLFEREASEFRIERIQDVTVETKGMAQTFLDFGSIYIQTAGDAREFVFHQVPSPEKAKELLLYERDQLEKMHHDTTQE